MITAPRSPTLPAHIPASGVRGEPGEAYTIRSGYTCACSPPWIAVCRLAAPPPSDFASWNDPHDVPTTTHGN